MLFNSYIFILFFLPITLGVYFTLGTYSLKGALYSLLFCSIVFYGWFNPAFLFYLCGSILINYFFCKLMLIENINSRLKLYIFIAALVFNLIVLLYFKYFLFLISNLSTLLNYKVNKYDIMLPLGISFITFQKIALLADVFKGTIKKINIFYFFLFSCFFPPLIAGPIIHFREIGPQLSKIDTAKLKLNNLTAGFSIFSLGLFKKIMIADNLALIADPLFLRVLNGESLAIVTAWVGALAYSFQIYFDFSAYSEMAVGLAKMLNITLPINFYSPYKSKNIITFWRTWHISLSRFIRDYIYIPLGGNKNGHIKKYINLLSTMTLCGLWHGANWTFVLWGAIHGLFLIVNNIWLLFKEKIYQDAEIIKNFYLKYFFTFLSVLTTFLCVSLTWVVFRADSCKSAYDYLLSICGIKKNIHYSLSNDELTFSLITLASVAVCVFSLPSVYDLFGKYPVFLVERDFKTQRNSLLLNLKWSPTVYWAFLISIVFFISFINIGKHSPFIYFQF